MFFSWRMDSLFIKQSWEKDSLFINSLAINIELGSESTKNMAV